jgi:hypothetical protein
MDFQQISENIKTGGALFDCTSFTAFVYLKDSAPPHIDCQVDIH